MYDTAYDNDASTDRYYYYYGTSNKTRKRDSDNYDIQAII